MKLYHATSENKAKLYRATGCIQKPVRGFTTISGAMAWAMRVNRKIIYEINADGLPCYKLPDHHNAFGDAWWVDSDVGVERIHCVYSAVNP